jgi:hypothetical protein
MNSKRNFDDPRFARVSPTIGINRLDSAHPTDNVTIGSPAENTVRLTIALEADEEWPSPSPLGGPLIAAFVAPSGMKWWIPIG